VAGLHAEQVGRAAVALGAGRATLDDVVDPGVGIEVLCAPGTQVRAGEPILTVHHRSGRGLAEALSLLTAAVQVSDAPPSLRPIILERIACDGAP
jgi:thymidine phosphorylase